MIEPAVNPKRGIGNFPALNPQNPAVRHPISPWDRASGQVCSFRRSLPDQRSVTNGGVMIQVLQLSPHFSTFSHEVQINS